MIAASTTCHPGDDSRPCSNCGALVTTNGGVCACCLGLPYCRSCKRHLTSNCFDEPNVCQVSMSGICLLISFLFDRSRLISQCVFCDILYCGVLAKTVWSDKKLIFWVYFRLYGQRHGRFLFALFLAPQQLVLDGTNGLSSSKPRAVRIEVILKSLDMPHLPHKGNCLFFARLSPIRPPWRVPSQSREPDHISNRWTLTSSVVYFHFQVCVKKRSKREHKIRASTDNVVTE